MIPASHAEALEALRGRDRRRVGANRHLQAKTDGTIALDLHGSEVVRYRPGAPSLVRPFFDDWSAWRTTATTLRTVNQALPAPLVRAELRDGRVRLVAGSAVQALEPGPGWHDLAALAVDWPAGIWS